MKAKILDVEYEVNPKIDILSETDTQGFITYVNDGFQEISGYSESFLAGKPHNVVRHPDMPKVVFKLLWEKLKDKQEMSAIVKNLRRDGQYYWVYSEYMPLFDDKRQLRGYRSFRKPVPRSAVQKIERIYKKLLETENEKDINQAEVLLDTFLLQEGVGSYKEYVDRLYERELKGLFGKFFGRLFGKK